MKKSKPKYFPDLSLDILKIQGLFIAHLFAN